MKGGSSPGSAGYSSLAAGDQSMTDSNLVQQVTYLKSKLEEEHANYKRKLQAYQDGQQRQAQLIQKLQQKVLQYKRKCGELETSVNESKTSEETVKKKVNYYEYENILLCMCSITCWEAQWPYMVWFSFFNLNF